MRLLGGLGSLETSNHITSQYKPLRIIMLINLHNSGIPLIGRIGHLNIHLNLSSIRNGPKVGEGSHMPNLHQFPCLACHTHNTPLICNSYCQDLYLPLCHPFQGSLNTSITQILLGPLFCQLNRYPTRTINQPNHLIILG